MYLGLIPFILMGDESPTVMGFVCRLVSGFLIQGSGSARSDGGSASVVTLIHSMNSQVNQVDVLQSSSV